jgi:hypothetical protein
MHTKYSIIFFLLTLVFPAAGQQLPEGTFIYSTGFTHEEFTFKSNQIFEYKFSSCTGGQEGMGIYTFKKRKLLLTFENPNNKPLPKTLSLIKQPTQNDTSYLSFRFFDQKDTTSVEGVIVKFINKSNGKMYGTQSNSVGQATLKIKNTDLPLELDISYIGMKSKSIKIDTCGNYSIVFPLNFEFLQPLGKGDTLQFLIDDYGDDKLVVKPIKEKEFRTFTKKDGQ